MDRRTYLSVTATATLGCVAGCQDTLADTETESEETTPKFSF